METIKEHSNDSRAHSGPGASLSLVNLTARHRSMAVRIGNRLAVWWQRYMMEGILLRRAKERFFLVFGGHIFFQTLHAAVQLDLFSLLAKNGPLTASEIAETLEIDDQPAEILLLGLTSTGLITKRGPRYRVTRLSRELLTRDSRNNIIPYVLLQHYGMYKAMPHLYEAIRRHKNVGLEEFQGAEPTFYQRLEHDPQLQKIFQDAMRALSVQTNRILCRFVDVSHIRHIVDVGGGDGTNLLALAKQHPHIRGTVFDLPSVCEIAAKNIRKYGMSDRIRTQPGDCFEDELPMGADCFLFAHFFTIWSKERGLSLLRKCFSALPPGGQVIVFNMMQNDDGTGPLSAAVGSPYFLTLATGEGMLYKWCDYESWMKEAGFSSVRRIFLPRDHGAIVGTKALSNGSRGAL